MELINKLVDVSRNNYKCYDELKRLLGNNEDFRNIIREGYLAGKVRGFDDSIWEKINRQNIRGIDNFESVFRDGANLGYCTVASKQLSYSLDSCFICGGVLPILKGTVNCVDGSHTWISVNGTIIDSTLMLMIDEDFAHRIGYIEENRYDPNIDPIYRAAKDFTLDSNLSKKGKL